MPPNRFFLIHDDRISGGVVDSNSFAFTTFIYNQNKMIWLQTSKDLIDNVKGQIILTQISSRKWLLKFFWFLFVRSMFLLTLFCYWCVVVVAVDDVSVVLMFLFALFFCLCFMFLFVHSFLLSKVNETCKAFYYDVVNGKGSLRYNIATPH